MCKTAVFASNKQTAAEREDYNTVYATRHTNEGSIQSDHCLCA